MPTRVVRSVLAPVCTVSALLTVQTGAYAQSAPDSLGLRAFNAISHTIPGEISIDATLGQLRAQAPELRASVLGALHAVFETPPRASDLLQTTFGFRADSGGILSRAFSSKVRLGVVDSHASYNDVDILLNAIRAHRAAATALGPPEYCDRDTIVSDDAGAIFIASQASWHRGEVRVKVSVNMNLRDVLPKLSAVIRRFNISYRVFRATDPLMQWDDALRHDGACLLTDDELRAHAAPLDSAAYALLRAELLQRPTKPSRQ